MRKPLAHKQRFALPIPPGKLKSAQGIPKMRSNVNLASEHTYQKILTKLCAKLTIERYQNLAANSNVMKSGNLRHAPFE